MLKNKKFLYSFSVFFLLVLTTLIALYNSTNTITKNYQLAFCGGVNNSVDVTDATKYGYKNIINVEVTLVQKHLLRKSSVYTASVKIDDKIYVANYYTKSTSGFQKGISWVELNLYEDFPMNTSQIKLMLNKDNSKIMIYLFERNNGNQFEYAGPAYNKDDALKIANNFYKPLT